MILKAKNKEIIMSYNIPKTKIKSKIKEILLCINNQEKFKDNGLLTGSTGISLFYENYYKIYGQKKYLNIALNHLISSFNLINDGYFQHTFCSGIGGICWEIEYFVKNKSLEIDSNETLSDLDEFLAKKMFSDLEDNDNYDFLHGAIGIGIYFLNHFSSPKSKIYLTEFIEKLEKKGIYEYDGSLKWISTVNEENNTKKEVFNLSLSHGMPSIIIFLAKAYKNDISKNLVKRMLESLVKYILKNRHNHQVYGSYFPSWLCENEIKGKSRLGWCYGDLGVALALYQAGVSLKNKVWYEFAIEIFIHSAERRDLINESVNDAGLCHGTAGIAHIFNRMYRNTGIEKFKETHEFWIKETLKMAKFEDGLAGYKTFYGEKYGGWKNEYGLLDGIAGIGLALISSVSDSDSKWDECLLLS